MVIGKNDGNRRKDLKIGQYLALPNIENMNLEAELTNPTGTKDLILNDLFVEMYVPIKD